MKPYVTVKNFESVKMTHRAGELFNPPGLTNFWGCCQSALDVMAVQHLTFPPYSHGDAPLGSLTVNDCCIATEGVPVAYRWRPDRIERACKVDGLAIETLTVMGVAEQSVTIKLTIKNPARKQRDVKLRIRTG